METLQISLDKQVADMATSYAKERGESLSSLVEAYLKSVVARINDKKNKADMIDPELQSIMGIASSLKRIEASDDERFTYIMRK